MIVKNYKQIFKSDFAPHPSTLNVYLRKIKYPVSTPKEPEKIINDDEQTSTSLSIIDNVTYEISDIPRKTLFKRRK